MDSELSQINSSQRSTDDKVNTDSKEDNCGNNLNEEVKDNNIQEKYESAAENHTQQNKLSDTDATVNNNNNNKLNKETIKLVDCNSEYISYENGIAIHTDPQSGYQYKWNEDKEMWEPKNDMVYGFEDDTHTYTDTDGVKYFWDKEKNAWFPKINDEFMAQYQMNYGFTDHIKEIETKVINKNDVDKTVAKKCPVKRKASEPQWFQMDDERNTKVYVSNLPTDITEQEFIDFMQKCGLIMLDPVTSQMKIKLYTEPGTNIKKGDGLCTYIRKESVELAIKLLDGTDLKGKKVKIEQAKFQMKGKYDPKLKPKMKKRKEKEKIKRMQEKLFDWRPEKLQNERSKHEKVVILRNVFQSSMFDKDVGLILEFQQDLREECSKCGTVRKVIIYDRHPEGIAQVNMSNPEEADACVQLLNGRWFGKRQLTAEIWDGKTKFKIAETDSQISQRLNNWDKFLEDDNKNKDDTKVDV